MLAVLEMEREHIKGWILAQDAQDASEQAASIGEIALAQELLRIDQGFGKQKLGTGHVVLSSIVNRWEHEGMHEHEPLPGTEQARNQGCTCTPWEEGTSGLRVRIAESPGCPLHGHTIHHVGGECFSHDPAKSGE